jgi:hypothetical protein
MEIHILTISVWKNRSNHFMKFLKRTDIKISEKNYGPERSKQACGVMLVA